MWACTCGRLFDLRTGTERWSQKLQNGVCTARFDRMDIPMNKLLTAGLDGRYCIYDARTQHPQQACHCPDERKQRRGGAAF